MATTMALGDPKSTTVLRVKEPSALEIVKFAAYLGMDLAKDSHLLWIAQEALRAPLPENWKASTDQQGRTVYTNFVTQLQTFEHPMDEYYRYLYLKKKLESEGTLGGGMVGGVVSVAGQPERGLQSVEHDLDQSRARLDQMIQHGQKMGQHAPNPVNLQTIYDPQAHMTATRPHEARAAPQVGIHQDDTQLTMKKRFFEVELAGVQDEISTLHTKIENLLKFRETNEEHGQQEGKRRDMFVHRMLSQQVKQLRNDAANMDQKRRDLAHAVDAINHELRERQIERIKQEALDRGEELESFRMVTVSICKTCRTIEFARCWDHSSLFIHRLPNDHAKCDSCWNTTNELQTCRVCCGQTDILWWQMVCSELEYAVHCYPPGHEIISHIVLQCPKCHCVGFPGVSNRLTIGRDGKIFVLDVDREMSEDYWRSQFTHDLHCEYGVNLPLLQIPVVISLREMRWLADDILPAQVRRKRKELEEAVAIMLQCNIRCMFARRAVRAATVLFVAQMDSATSLQCAWRANRARRILEYLASEFRQQNEAALSIQRLHRGGKARVATRHRRTMYDAAKLLQRIMRGHRGRNAFRRRQAKLQDEEQASKVLQKRFRGMHARKRTKQLRAERAELVKASTSIQSGFRGMRERRAARRRRLDQGEQKQKRNKAAAIIQAHWHGYVVKRDLYLKQVAQGRRTGAAMAFQSGPIGGKGPRAQEMAALRLQRWWRQVAMKLEAIRRTHIRNMQKMLGKKSKKKDATRKKSRRSKSPPGKRINRRTGSPPHPGPYGFLRARARPGPKPLRRSADLYDEPDGKTAAERYALIEEIRETRAALRDMVSQRRQYAASLGKLELALQEARYFGQQTAQPLPVSGPLAHSPDRLGRLDKSLDYDGFTSSSGPYHSKTFTDILIPSDVDSGSSRDPSPAHHRPHHLRDRDRASPGRSPLPKRPAAIRAARDSPSASPGPNTPLNRPPGISGPGGSGGALISPPPAPAPVGVTGPSTLPRLAPGSPYAAGPRLGSGGRSGSGGGNGGTRLPAAAAASKKSVTISSTSPDVRRRSRPGSREGVAAYTAS